MSKNVLDIPSYKLKAFDLRDVILMMVASGLLSYIIGFAHSNYKTNQAEKVKVESK